MKADKTYVLAVDLGTSGCKTALVSLGGEVAAWHFEPVETRLFGNGGAEQEPQDWWDAFLKTARAVLDSAGAAPESIAAVCCSTQGKGTIPVDAEGKVLHPCILWMDTRGAEYLREITGKTLRVAGYGPLRLRRWIRLTGGAPSLTGKDPAAHMLLIKHAMPDIYRNTAKFLNVPDYMNLRLTGRIVATPDSILTSWVTDNRDPARIVYHDGLVRNSQIEKDKFPEIVPSTEVIGTLLPEVAEQLGLPSTVPVVAGSIDTTAAAIGSRAVADYDAHLYLGTSSWLAAHVPFKKTDIFASLASVPCALKDRYLMIALQATAGGNLTFLRDKILYHKDELLAEASVPDVYALMDQIVERTPPGSNGVLFTPWSFGERSPVEDPLIRAGIHNLSLENSREDIIRAFFEGIAFNNRWLLKPVERFLGRKLEAITLTGGGANSDVWCQIFADVLQRRIRQLADPIQVNVLGAAFIAFLGLGRITKEEIPHIVRHKAVYKPRSELRTLYNDLFREFVALYERNKAIHHRLNRKRTRS